MWYIIRMITSKENEKIKNLKQLLKNKQYLFIDNPKVVLEAVDGGYVLECLIVNAENFGADLTKFEKFKEKMIEVNSAVFKLFSTTCNSQGIIGVIKNKERQLATPKGNFVVLDALQDPGNVGTILRSALGADFKDIYLVDCVNALNDKLVRSSMGAIFKLNIYECTKSEFLDFQKDLRADLYVGHMQGENVFELNAQAPFGIVVGNEGNGVSKEMFEIANKKVCVPMKNNLESLNVGVAASLIMYILNKENI